MVQGRIWLIYNPVAGNRRAAKRLPDVVARLEAAGHEVTVIETAGPGKAAAQVQWLLSHEQGAIAVLGGDGTVHEVINGFIVHGQPARPDARLIILNGGTGGDFARGLGLPRDPVAGVDALAQAQPRPLDLGWIQCMGLDGQPTSRAFMNIADIGLAGDVVERVNRTTKMFGGFASFLWGTLASLANAEPRYLELAIDDEPTIAGRYVMLALANGRYNGGGMDTCPVADSGDGSLDLVSVGDFSRWQLYGKLPLLYQGKHLAKPGISHRRFHTLRVTTPEPVWVEADGELIGTTPATIRVVPAACQILV